MVFGTLVPCRGLFLDGPCAEMLTQLSQITGSRVNAVTSEEQCNRMPCFLFQNHRARIARHAEWRFIIDANDLDHVIERGDTRDVDSTVVDQHAVNVDADDLSMGHAGCAARLDDGHSRQGPHDLAGVIARDPIHDAGLDQAEISYDRRRRVKLVDWRGGRRRWELDRDCMIEGREDIFRSGSKRRPLGARLDDRRSDR